MAEKTYITPGLKEPEIIVTPKGAVNESTGVKLKRRAIKFYPNHKGQGQFTTSDPKLQELLDNHPWQKMGKLTCVGAHGVVPADKPESKTEGEVEEQTQAVGPATSESAVKGKRGKK